jgi:hypothetical protein
MMFLFLVSCATKSVTGSIYNSEGVPIQDAIISLERQQTISDQNGDFTIEPIKLKKGHYTLKVTHEGYVFVEEEYKLKGAKVQIPKISLEPLDVEVPYLQINLDPVPIEK